LAEIIVAGKINLQLQTRLQTHKMVGMSKGL
jgi:hypothetical protein